MVERTAVGRLLALTERRLFTLVAPGPDPVRARSRAPAGVLRRRHEAVAGPDTEAPHSRVAP
jgi:hypothetical protein